MPLTDPTDFAFPSYCCYGRYTMLCSALYFLFHIFCNLFSIHIWYPTDSSPSPMLLLHADFSLVYILCSLMFLYGFLLYFLVLHSLYLVFYHSLFKCLSLFCILFNRHCSLLYFLVFFI